MGQVSSFKKPQGLSNPGSSQSLHPIPQGLLPLSKMAATPDEMKTDCSLFTPCSVYINWSLLVVISTPAEISGFSFITQCKALSVGRTKGNPMVLSFKNNS
jgi:hypothetical protein